MLIINALLLTTAGLAALVGHSVLPLVLGMAAAIAVWAIRIHRAGMTALSQADVLRSRAYAATNVILVLLTWLVH